jgi:UDP-N-acetylmuramoylalanine--D-glutamate ligase
MAEFPFKQVLVVGLGESGLAAAQKLLAVGAKVTVTEVQNTPLLQQRAQQLQELGATVFLKEHSLDLIEDKELIVASPGVPKEIELFRAARRRNLPVWSEVELAYFFLKERNVTLVGVTGTNGKTTTVELLGAILRRAGYVCRTGGNIGYPLVKLASEVGEGEYVVAELSSFQLEHIVNFRAKVALILNITKDHLDWHSNLQDYIEAKANIFKNQQSGDLSVLNRDDPRVWALKDRVPADYIGFSRKYPLPNGVYSESGYIVANFGGLKEKVIELDEVALFGEHNYENAMAATAAALFLGVQVKTAREVLKSFSGLPHRIEYAGQIGGVKFFNDSKATNPDATVRALLSFSEPLILLMGGKDKGNDFTVVAEAVKGRAKDIILFGEAAEQISRTLRAFGCNVTTVSTLKEAIQEGFKKAKSGDVVLLSPGCASFDEFRDYKERGDFFKHFLKELAVEKTG